VKGGASGIEGAGVHAIEAIASGEVVAVKGGHLVDGAAVASLPEAAQGLGVPDRGRQLPGRADQRRARQA